MPDICLARFSTNQFLGPSCQRFTPVLFKPNTGLLHVAADSTRGLLLDSSDRLPVAHPLLSKLGECYD